MLLLHIGLICAAELPERGKKMIFRGENPLDKT
jgi:hypothetical protein